MLSVRNLSVRFGGVRAVDDVSFDVQRGEVFHVDRAERCRQDDRLQPDQPALHADRRDDCVRGRVAPRPRAARGSILSAVVVADEAVARGVKRFRAYAVAIVAASVFAAAAQFQVRAWLGVYTVGDQPEAPPATRRMQMVSVGCDTLTYGVLFMLAWLEYRRRAELLRRVRFAELERARSRQRGAETRLAALRSDVDAEALLTTLEDVRDRFERDDPGADVLLDEVIAGFRAKLLRSEAAPRDEAGRSSVPA